MRSKTRHSTFPLGAAVSILLAFAIGFAPVATMLALSPAAEALQ